MTKILSRTHMRNKKQAFLLFLILNITFGISRAILAVLWTQVSGIQTD